MTAPDRAPEPAPTASRWQRLREWGAVPVALPFGWRIARGGLAGLVVLLVALVLLIVFTRRPDPLSPEEIRRRTHAQMERIEQRVREIEAKAKAAPGANGSADAPAK